MYSLAPEVHVQFVFQFVFQNVSILGMYCFNKLYHYNAIETVTKRLWTG